MTVWFFERASRIISLEIRYDNDRGEYVAVVIDAEGCEAIERFASARTFRSWLIAWETALADQRWRPSGSPIVMPEDGPGLSISEVRPLRSMTH
jgi:hypothetical protein